MDNFKNIRVICQCLHVLNISGFRSIFHDHRVHKLYSGKAIELHLIAQLLQLPSYDLIAEQLHAHPTLRKAIDLESISASQLSRKTKTLCTENLQHLFYWLIRQINERTKPGKKQASPLGALHLIDGTNISLPHSFGRWAQCGKKKTAVHLHVSLVATDPSMVYPGQVIATTSNVSEQAISLELVLDKEATYVMDRGYEKCQHFEDWTRDGFRFVIRVRDRLRLFPIEGRQRSVPTAHNGVNILRDEDVLTNKTTIPIRLVEFEDDKQRRYRLLTSRWDVDAHEIAQIYKCRWQIELFFKWVKQHLKLVKLHSAHPTAVWNQIFLSLIAYAVSLLVKLQLQTDKSQWEVMKLLQTYMYKDWQELLEALHRVPSRRS